MFLFFKPPQSYLQVQLLDPDGFSKQKDLEEAYAIKMLLARKEKATKTIKKKKASFKEKIQAALAAGETTVEIANQLAEEVIAAEPQFVFTEQMKVDVDQIVAEYKRQVAEEIRKMVLAQIEEQAVLAVAMELEYQQKLAAKKLKELNNKKLRVLYLLASMDETDE